MKNPIFALFCIIVLVIVVFFFYSGAIFQRGNPLPYMSKMVTLSDDNQFAKVFADADIYLSRNSNYDELIKHIESTFGVTFSERMGSAYIFNSDNTAVFASTEIYWRYYMVWEIEVQIPTVDSLGYYEAYTLDGFSFCYPAKWEMTKREELGGIYTILLRDYDVPVKRWHSVDVYTYIQVVVSESEPLSYKSARERMEKDYNDLRADDKDANLSVIDGVEISKVTHSRPYFSYKSIQMYFQYNDKEYLVGIHYDNDDDEIVEIVEEFLESLAFDRG